MTRHSAGHAHALGIALAIAGLAAVPRGTAAQSLESRIAAASGSVSFTYVTRPNVCGDGSSINVSDDSSAGWTVRSGRRGIHVGTRRGARYERCDQGPARVLLRRSGTRVVELSVSVGGAPERGDTDIGDVPPAEAARYLLAIAPQLEGRGGDHAVLGAQIADGVVVWPRLLQIARDDGASESARKAAVFWVSQEAGVAATRGLDSLAVDDDVDISVRSDALFHLAHRPRGEGIPALLRVVESSKSIKLRKDAIFFLAQSRDDRALALFERLLVGR
jgi:hypothetical protein